jgi:hypothetical protein
VPGRNASEADTNFAHYLRESLSVLTTSVLLASRDGNERILLYREPVKLPRKSGNPLFIDITQTYLIVAIPEGFKAQTTGYTYSVLGKEGEGFREILVFHWHPLTTKNLKWPHMHVVGNTFDGDLGRVHIPTGRLAIEDFVRVLIRDFDVKARVSYEESKKILTRNKSAFCESASWLYWKPLI